MMQISDIAYSEAYGAGQRDGYNGRRKWASAGGHETLQRASLLRRTHRSTMAQDLEDAYLDGYAAGLQSFRAELEV